MKIQVRRQTETRQVRRTLAVDPPMKHYVVVKKSFPGAF